MYVLKASCEYILIYLHCVDLLSCIAHKFSTGTLTFCPKEKEQKFAMKGVTMSMGLLTFCSSEVLWTHLRLLAVLDHHQLTCLSKSVTYGRTRLLASLNICWRLISFQSPEMIKRTSTRIRVSRAIGRDWWLECLKMFGWSTWNTLCRRICRNASNAFVFTSLGETMILILGLANSCMITVTYCNYMYVHLPYVCIRVLERDT